MEQVRTEQRFLRLFEERAGVPAVGQMGSLAIAKTVLPGREGCAIGKGPWRCVHEVAHVLMLTKAPTWLQITSALGAAARHSLSEPHLSDSKWLKPM
jgi:hypothetical protein